VGDSDLSDRAVETSVGPVCRPRGVPQGTDLVPTLACIIPVTGTTVGLETTLLSVLEQRPADCEVLVALGTPYDDPYSLQGEVQFLDASRNAGMVECINVGLAATNAPFVHILANGFEATDGWTTQALAHFNNPRVGSVTPVICNSQNRDELLSAGVRYRRGGRRTVCTSLADSESELHRPIGPSISAAFYRRSAIDALGKQLPAEMGDELADLDFAMSLRRAGWGNIVEPNAKVLGPAVESTSSTGFLAGLRQERFFWRHAAEMGRAAELAAHVPAVIGSLARSTWQAPAQLFGRFIALCQFGNYRHYQQLLASAAETTTAVQSCLAAHSEMAQRTTKEKTRPVRIDEPHAVQPMKSNVKERARRK
jgi:GT2 family glycosyltransferase